MQSELDNIEDQAKAIVAETRTSGHDYGMPRVAGRGTLILAALTKLREGFEDGEHALSVLGEVDAHAIRSGVDLRGTVTGPKTRRYMGFSERFGAVVDALVSERQQVAALTAKVEPMRKEVLELLARAALAEATINDGARMIASERARQRNVEGWTPEHDDRHQAEEMVDAARCYLSAGWRGSQRNVRLWPWEAKWWKPKDRIANLVKAGALVAAEIDRLRRLAGAPAESASQETVPTIAGWPTSLRWAPAGPWRVRRTGLDIETVIEYCGNDERRTLGLLEYIKSMSTPGAPLSAGEPLHETLEHLCESLPVLWAEISLAPDESLTADAIRTKRALLRLKDLAPLNLGEREQVMAVLNEAIGHIYSDELRQALDALVPLHARLSASPEPIIEERA